MEEYERITNFILEARLNVAGSFDIGGHLKVYSDIKKFNGLEYKDECYSGGRLFVGREMVSDDDGKILWVNNYEGEIFEEFEGMVGFDKIWSFITESRIKGKFLPTLIVSGNWIYTKVSNLSLRSEMFPISKFIRSEETVHLGKNLLYECHGQCGFLR